ncbi:nitroreductase family protein [Candidatus Palauibacter sp.]|uniref:nitroreductase family protein n=1 Tax=Candidatus Palauibacter sp. TaxID=3101350 RepID=UPI003AF29517
MRLTRLLHLARNRRRVLRFDDRLVAPDTVEAVLEAARYAPSAREAQPWRFVVVQEALARHRIATAAFNHPHVRLAPVVIVCCARIHSHVSGTGRQSFTGDLAAAIQTMVLTAADLGLQSSWIYGFREPDVRRVVGVPEDVPVVALFCLGFQDGLAELAERRPRDEVIAWDRWSAGAKIAP